MQRAENLPVDVLWTIIDVAAADVNEDLVSETYQLICTCALTCSVVSPQAQRNLHYFVWITGLNCCRYFARTMKFAPHLALLVREVRNTRRPNDANGALPTVI